MKIEVIERLQRRHKMRLVAVELKVDDRIMIMDAAEDCWRERNMIIAVLDATKQEYTITEIEE